MPCARVSKPIFSLFSTLPTFFFVGVASLSLDVFCFVYFDSEYGSTLQITLDGSLAALSHFLTFVYLFLSVIRKASHTIFVQVSAVVVNVIHLQMSIDVTSPVAMIDQIPRDLNSMTVAVALSRQLKAQLRFYFSLVMPS